MFVDIYNECYKTQTIRSSNRDNKTWISTNLKKMITERDRLFESWSNDAKNMIKRLQFTRYRNKCCKAITKCKNKYDKQSILDCNKNIKKIWDKINTMMGKEKQSLDSIILSNMEESNEKAICDKFANTFTTEIEQIKHTCNDKWLDRDNYVQESDLCMRWQPVSADYVNRIINKMDSNKSPGSDLIRMSDLKTVVNNISPVIAKLINLSVSHSKFPKELKQAIVRPIHKKSDRKLYSNYRPISILSSVDKVIEKCIIDQIGSYLQKNHILNKCQHGFQKQKSTNTLLSVFTDEINTYLSEKQFIVAVFFDFKKAFDTLETGMLLKAMEECGVGRPLNQWFRDYLTARSFRVKVGEGLSDEQVVRCGVPQGSGCGPLCYLMHVNSLCGTLRHCSAHMFADDLCALRAGTDLALTCQLVQEDVDAVVKWSHDNGIVLNTDKTKLMLIHSPYLIPKDKSPPIFTHSFTCLHNNIIPVNCTCTAIEKVSSVTYLGLKIDENFSWSPHIDFICSKLRILLCKFYHLSYRLPTSTLKCLYHSIVESILSYALDSYGLTFKTNIDKLEMLQIRFLKLLVNKKTKDNCKNNYQKLFKICKILPVSSKLKYLLAVNNYDNLKYLHLVRHKHNTRTMTAGKYEVPRVSNYYGDRTLKKRIPYIINTLPADIVHEPKKARFKYRLKKYLMDAL